jgi:hypothetical protein
MLVCPLLLAACVGTGVTDADSGALKPDTTKVPPVGTVQRTSLTVRVQLDPSDQALAATAGVIVPGITVRLTRNGSNDAPRTATTDANGSVRFDALLDGIYSASAERVLSATELQRLPVADRDASVFAAGATIVVSPPTAATASMSLVAARRGTLVISEFFDYQGYPIPYNWGSYLEVYNNGDSTAYLDGMYITRTLWSFLQTTTFADCDAPSYLPYRRDVDRVWVQGGLQFPGSGREYAVPPGEARVYALDALDHRAASGSDQFADLSGAQFEHYASSSDTDNPSAVNMLPAFGTTTGSLGRGFRISSTASWILVKAKPESQFQTATLTPINAQAPGGVPFTPQPMWGIPREDIVDIFSVDFSPGYKAYLATTSFTYTLCLPWLPEVFERAAAEVEDKTFRPGAIRRRSLGRTSDGREILMRTRTSARDLEVTTSLLQRSLNRGR